MPNPLPFNPLADAELRRLARVKKTDPVPIPSLGPEVVSFFKHSVEKRHTKLGKIAEKWTLLIPPLFQEHTCLESFSRGTLTVLVDSSAHLYDLKQLLLAGLQQQLLLACRSTGLKKIALKPGRWYSDDPSRRPSFET
jgi:hypothetical protein